MELGDFYISDDIINIIYNNLYIIDKINFTIVNKYMFTNYYNKTQMYHLDFFLNNDYIKFYNLLNKYDYEKVDIPYLEKICFESIKFLNSDKYVYLNNTQGFGDYRFIFELLYKYDIINKYMIKQYSPHFYKHFYSFIEKSIVKNDRNKTIENINNSDMIFSLKRKFKPFSKKNKINWIQLVE